MDPRPRSVPKDTMVAQGGTPRRIGLTLALLVALLIPARPVNATPALAGPAGFAAGYATPVVVMAEKEAVTFYNFDIAPHDFVADGAYLSKKAARKKKWCSAFPKGKCPLFWSPRVPLGESTEVLGLEALSAGSTFTFFCTIHPSMKGTLVVR